MLRSEALVEAFFYLARLVPYFVLGGLYFSGQAVARVSDDRWKFFQVCSAQGTVFLKCSLMLLVTSYHGRGLRGRPCL